MRKNAKDRITYLLLYIKCCFISFRIFPYTDLQDKGDGAKFPFALAVLCGTSIELVINTLQ